VVVCAVGILIGMVLLDLLAANGCFKPALPS
jgi:hypothetical protein